MHKYDRFQSNAKIQSHLLIYVKSRASSPLWGPTVVVQNPCPGQAAGARGSAQQGFRSEPVLPMGGSLCWATGLAETFSQLYSRLMLFLSIPLPSLLPPRKDLRPLPLPPPFLCHRLLMDLNFILASPSWRTWTDTSYEIFVKNISFFLQCSNFLGHPYFPPLLLWESRPRETSLQCLRVCFKNGKMFWLFFLL